MSVFVQFCNISVNDKNGMDDIKASAMPVIKASRARGIR